MNKIYWTTKDGEKIDVDKMDENHLKNVLKMIIKNNYSRNKNYTEETLKEIGITGFDGGFFYKDE